MTIAAIILKGLKLANYFQVLQHILAPIVKNTQLPIHREATSLHIGPVDLIVEVIRLLQRGHKFYPLCQIAMKNAMN